MKPVTQPLSHRPPSNSWRFHRSERIGLALGLVVVLAFGAQHERRTALRSRPMTDLGVFACAAWAVRSGDNPYTVSDWNGWHYHYPPLTAILMAPLAHPLPDPAPTLPREQRTRANTPWGYELAGDSQYYPLGPENVRFFFIIAVWYLLSVTALFLSLHALGAALEGRRMAEGPPDDPRARQAWWARRLLPMLICLPAIGTVLARGQMELMLVLAISLALYAASRKRDVTAGLLLALPACVKLFPGLLLAWPLWRRRWRMLAGAMAGLVLGLMVIPVVALGPTRTVTLYRTWVEVLVLPGLGQGSDTSRATELTGMNATDNQSLLTFVHNWSHRSLPLDERPREASPAARLGTLAVCAAAFAGVLALAGFRRQDTARGPFLFVGLLTGVMFLASPVTHAYYFVLLLPLLMALTDAFLEAPPASPTRRWLIAAGAFFLLIEIIGRLPGSKPLVRDLGFPLLTLLTVLAAGAALWWRDARRSREGAPCPHSA